MTHRGSCLCQGVRYTIAGPLRDIANCHCAMCRKLHASAFRTSARVASKDWTTLSGASLITFYQSSPGEYKGFCSRCGSSLFTKFDAKPEIIGVPLGTLDNDPGIKPTRHIFVGSKAPWFDITDALPQHDAM
jgi:hypothetical protein